MTTRSEAKNRIRAGHGSDYRALGRPRPNRGFFFGIVPIVPAAHASPERTRFDQA
jgi:hypothetical protein